ncbi:Mesaconyl-C(4)-CoA hydratase [Fulvia fulva]|uniref:Mesaconyl-C(4)-CoA hydratase n=1 Tax=Passalora fulva TaxID=5499 RepID=A0A9Q8P9H4_PASFU|nr:Mesaconyl-C(4)-CoA hydratase [Fulvia fulva]UJO18062.1 Mesaconyl-C(4)-CoA hydratase [Fulvia fulva]WPV15187.1 Mesaconyl-C(4)-CoA hydratase [Fulvia fulva]
MTRTVLSAAVRAGQRSAFPVRSSVLSDARTFHATTSLQQKKPEAIAEAFLSKFAHGKEFVRKQLLDANQLRLFSLTSDRTKLWPGSESLEQNEPAAGTPLPAGYHNAYFTPTQLPGALGIDGTDTSYNPEAPFTRRMWAGGSIHWPGADPSASSQSYLKVGDIATEVTKVKSCEVKTIKKTGEAMLVVGVVKEFLDSKDNLCVTDNRNWVFREALDPSKRAKSPQKPPESTLDELKRVDGGKLVRHFNRDPPTLFRFSALTFNAHRIHYDKPWSVDVEGHRDTVVHGPLNMLGMLDLWRDEYAGIAGKEILLPKSLKYRATSPVYVGEGYRILIEKDTIDQSEVPIEVVSNDGTSCMKGTVERY